MDGKERMLQTSCESLIIDFTIRYCNISQDFPVAGLVRSDEVNSHKKGLSLNPKRHTKSNHNKKSLQKIAKKIFPICPARFDLAFLLKALTFGGTASPIIARPLQRTSPKKNSEIARGKR